ncbi:MAG: hypothetical protein JWL98_1724 [Xanthomonadaceae bacterium]|nr:hypothetical protein [Xanthomonadaceae bacterium]
MTDIVLHDIDPRLHERIATIGRLRGWDIAETLLQVLEHGLEAFDSDAAAILADNEISVLEAAIAALEHVPNDPGFAMIGRATPATPPPAEPDQSIDPGFALEPSASGLVDGPKHPSTARAGDDGQVARASGERLAGKPGKSHRLDKVGIDPVGRG